MTPEYILANQDLVLSQTKELLNEGMGKVKQKIVDDTTLKPNDKEIVISMR